MVREHVLRGPATAASFSGATASMIGALVGRYVFHGATPVEVEAWLQYAVPLGVAWIAGEVTARRAERSRGTRRRRPRK